MPALDIAESFSAPSFLCKAIAPSPHHLGGFARAPGAQSIAHFIRKHWAFDQPGHQAPHFSNNVNFVWARFAPRSALALCKRCQPFPEVLHLVQPVKALANLCRIGAYFTSGQLNHPIKMRTGRRIVRYSQLSAGGDIGKRRLPGKQIC